MKAGQDGADSRSVSRSCSPILMLTGCPRSGTKLLRHMLNQHSRIAMTTNETEFLPYLLRYCKDGKMEAAGGFERFSQYLRLETYFVNRQREHQEGPRFECWKSRCKSFIPAAMFEAFLRVETGQDGEEVILGDKSPGYVRLIDEILDELPRAKVLAVVRDPRSQAGSLKLRFGKSPIISAEAWKTATANIEVATTKCPDRIALIRYEDLTLKPRKTMGEICAFLGTSYEETMIRVDRHLENDPTYVGISGPTEVELREADLTIYRKYLSRDEIASVEAVAGAAMERHGYERENLEKSPRANVPGHRLLERIQALVRFSWVNVKRYGCRDLLRRVRLVWVRKRILSGHW